MLALGTVAHDSILMALGLKKSSSPSSDMARNTNCPAADVMIDSYHCSRYNTNTRRLTADMFHDGDEAGQALAGLQ